MITSAALGKITVGPGDDPAAVWDQLRALAAGGGLPPLAAVRLALAAVELIGSPQGQAAVEVAAVSGEGGAHVQAVVHGGSGRRDGPAARLADTCRPHLSASGVAGQMVGVSAAQQAAAPDAGPPWQDALSPAAQRGSLTALLAAALIGLDDQAQRLAEYHGEITELRAELDATSQGLLALHAELSDQRDELERAHAAAERAGQAKAAFLASMSHEIRSPLNAMIGFTSLLRETALTPEQTEYADTFAAASGHLKDLVNGILDLSKVESGQLELEDVPFDLVACIEDAAGIVAPLAEEKGLALAALVAPELPALVAGDPLRLRQILVNLLSNAVKFTDRGQVTIAVSAQPGAIAHDERSLVFDVRDTGPGIAATAMERLFDPFTQADASTARRFGGTGLGLAICKQLTERMGGQLTVASTPGHGATFTAAIPLRQPALTAAGEQPDRPLAGVHVLLVHPQPSVAEAARQHLVSWGAAVTVAASAASAARRAAEWADAALALVGSNRPAGLTAAMRTVAAAHTGGPLPMVALTPLVWRPAAPPIPLPWALTTAPIRRARLREAVLGALGRPDPARGTAPAEPTMSPARVLRILVAEDDPDAQRFITGLLHRLGHQADLASDGEQAAAAIAGGGYDLVLMEVELPGLDGIAATELARAQRPGNHPPVIALTGDATPGIRRSCLRAGMNGFLTKPLRPSDLADLIAKVTAQHGAPGAPAPGGPPAPREPVGNPPAATTVLYIDDNPTLRGLAERILTKDPAITVLTAGAGTGLQQAVLRQPDLILLDLQMPSAHGEKLLGNLRRDGATRAIPIIVVSGDTSPATVKRLTGLGATAYLAKPFDAEHLRAIVAATAARSRPAAAAIGLCGVAAGGAGRAGLPERATCLSGPACPTGPPA